MPEETGFNRSFWTDMMRRYQDGQEVPASVRYYLRLALILCVDAAESMSTLLAALEVLARDWTYPFNEPTGTDRSICDEADKTL